MHFGERLRRARRLGHLSQAALAEALGVSSQSISRWEREETLPQAHYRLQLARFFDIDPGEWFSEPRDQDQDRDIAPLPAIWHVPFASDPYFTGREAVLQNIHALLQPSSPTSGTHTLALNGLAGAGKTQTALAYAYRFGQTYDAVLWLQAGTYETLLSEFVALAQVLQLPVQRPQDAAHSVQVVKDWLRTHHRWLLIFDDVEDLVWLNRLNIPGTSGYLLLTTRSQYTGTLAQSLHLEAMTEEEGLLFLLHRSKLLPLQHSLEQVEGLLRDSASKVFDLLGGLPLALDQAGAYIEEAGCTFVEYLQRYEEQRLQLLDHRGSMGVTHPLSVAATFRLVYAQVRRLSPLAADLLCFSAFLCPENIPEELFGAALPALEASPQSQSVNFYRIDQVFSLLRRFSLIYRHTEARLFCVHPLVQTVLREDMAPEAVQKWLESAVQALNATFPETRSARTAVYERYIPHIQACERLMTRLGVHFPEATSLFQKAGDYLTSRGQFTEAKQLLAEAFASTSL